MRIKSIIILSTAILLASCSKEVGPDSGGLEMRVVPSLAGEGVKASITTADLTEFWLRVDCPASATYSYFCKVSKNSTGWSPDKQLYWRDEATAVSYLAACFSDHNFTKAEFTSGVDLAVPADQSTQAGLNAADLLTLSGASKKYSDDLAGELPVTLAHGLTKVNIVLSLGEDFYDNNYGLTANPVKALTVTGTNLGFNFQPTTGTVTVKAGTEADITPFALSYTPGTATAKTSVATYEAILVPQTFAAGTFTISFNVRANNYVWTNAETITLTAGQTVNLPVSVTTAPPVSAFIKGHRYVDMGEVTIGGVTKNLLWATCNVGANNPWDYGDIFAWGETVTKSDYGWGTYSLGDGTTFSRYTGSDYSTLQFDDDAANKLWGGYWHIPTEDEWTALCSEIYYTWQWTADYLGDGSNHAGKIITRNNVSGTDPCAGNSIFLPAAGYRNGTFFGNTEENGYYWSSSLNSDSPDYAWFMSFSYSAIYRTSYYRYYGRSLRPVTE